MKQSLLVLAATAAMALCACQPSPPAPSTTPSTTPATDAANATTPTTAPAPLPAPADPAQAAADAAAAQAQQAEQAVNADIDRMLGDHAQYQALFVHLQQAVETHNAAAVAALVHYPFTATIEGKRRAIKNAEAFREHYDAIVTPAIADAIVQQRYGDLMVNGKGVMFGSGQVWLNGVCRDQACEQADARIITIQSGAPSP